MTMFPRFVVRILLVVAALTALASPPGRGAPRDDTLVVALPQGEEGTAALSDVVGNFSAAVGHPARLTLYDDVEVGRRLVEGERVELPDVLVVPSEYLPFLADAGAIAALDGAVAKAVWDDFVPGVLDSITYRGERWAIPLEGNPYGLFCNLALFRDAGIEQVPRTWEQTLAAAEALARDTDGDGEIDRYGYTQCTFQLPLLLLAYGCDLLNHDGTDAGFDNDGGLEALRLYHRLRDTSPSIGFEHGNIGMKVSIIGNLARYAHLDYDVVALPQGKRRANSFGGAEGILCVVVCRGAHEDQALEFARFLLRPEISLLWYTATCDVPLRRSILDSWAYRRFLRERPRVRTFVEELPYCRPRPCIKAYIEIKDALAQVSHQVRALDDPTDAQLRDLLDVAAARVRVALAKERGH